MAPLATNITEKLIWSFVLLLMEPFMMSLSESEKCSVSFELSSNDFCRIKTPKNHSRNKSQKVKLCSTSLVSSYLLNVNKKEIHNDFILYLFSYMKIQYNDSTTYLSIPCIILHHFRITLSLITT